MLGISLLVLGLVTGIGILSTGYNILASVNPFNLVAGEVTYTNNSQSTVQGAIDELFNKSNTWVNPNNFGIKLNSVKTVMATPMGVCIKRNGTVYCFKTNNWAEEQNHIQQVFSDISCSVGSSNVICSASDFYCVVDSDGRVNCCDSSYCDVKSVGSVNCN